MDVDSRDLSLRLVRLILIGLKRIIIHFYRHRKLANGLELASISADAG